LHKVVTTIPEQDWVPIPYFIEGAAVAETTYRPFARSHKAKAVRLIVRRVPPTPGSQLAPYTEYSYHAFITNRSGEMRSWKPTTANTPRWRMPSGTSSTAWA